MNCVRFFHVCTSSLRSSYHLENHDDEYFIYDELYGCAYAVQIWKKVCVCVIQVRKGGGGLNVSIYF